MEAGERDKGRDGGGVERCDFCRSLPNFHQQLLALEGWGWSGTAAMVHPQLISLPQGWYAHIKAYGPF